MRDIDNNNKLMAFILYYIQMWSLVIVIDRLKHLSIIGQRLIIITKECELFLILRETMNIYHNNNKEHSTRRHVLSLWYAHWLQFGLIHCYSDHDQRSNQSHEWMDGGQCCIQEECECRWRLDGEDQEVYFCRTVSSSERRISILASPPIWHKRYIYLGI